MGQKAIGIDAQGHAVMQDTDQPWYLVLTTPQGERKAATELRRAGLRVYLPKQTYIRPGKTTSRRATREKRVYRPLWTGYMLCRFTEATSVYGYPNFGLVRDCEGVRDFLKWETATGGVEPIPLSDKLVMAYMRRQRSRDYDGVKMARQAAEAKRSAYKPGQTVRVTEGPFASFLARIDKLQGNKAHIIVEIFGRDTPIVMDNFTKTLEPLASRRKAA